MKKFLLITQSTRINNFETINSSDLVSIGTMINDLEGMQGYVVVDRPKIQSHISEMIPITFEEALQNRFDMIVTSQFAANAFGGVVGKSFTEFTKYCQNYPTVPVFQYSLDRKINLTPLYLRWPELEIKNPVYPVISYETEDYLERSKKDTVTNVKEIIELDLHSYSPYMLKNHQDIYVNTDVEDNQPDLIYGGIFRPDRKKFFDEYLDENETEFVSEVYGTLPRKGYGVIKTGKIPQTKIVAKNSTAWTTILPPEKGYDTIVQVRVFESFSSNAVTMIHTEYDPHKKLLPNTPFRYFSTKEEYIEKLNEIKRKADLRFELLEDQHDFVKNFKTNEDELKAVVERVLQG